MSKPYDEKLCQCDRCANDFPISEIIVEGELHWCKSCYYLMTEGGEV